MSIAHIVDDDEAIRDALTWLLRSREVESLSWPSAEAFLADYRPEMRGCIVLDIRMPAMSGPELFDRLTAMGCRMPTIFLTGSARRGIGACARTGRRNRHPHSAPY